MRRILYTDYVSLKSSELREGMIVYCHGMLVLLDGAIQSRDMGDQPGLVYWQRGRVLNVEEIDDPWLVSMTREYEPWPNRHVPTGEHRWTIQGNDLATWGVIVLGPQTAERAADDEAAGDNA